MINFDVLMNNFWHLAVHSSELSKPGDYFKYDYFDKEIVLYNDGKEILAFDNVCPHRGARFFSDNRGNSMAVCKYHGWTIANGALHIPSAERFIKCTKTYNRYQVDYCGSFIFFSINPKSTLSDQLGTFLFDLIESISFDCNKLVDVNQYEYQCNALVAIENALEPDHVPFVHAKTLQPLHLTNCQNEFYGKNSIVKFEIGNLKIKKGLDRLLKLFDVGAQNFDGYMSIHIFPFGFISSTCGHSYSIQNFFPISDNKSNFTSKLYFSGLKSNINEDIVKHFIESTISVNRQVFDEDHEICKRIKFNSWLDLFDGSLSVDELKILKFRQNIIDL